MKLSLNRDTLLKPLQLVIGVVERKQTLPILSNVLLRTKDNNLSITGSDLEVELIGQSKLDVNVQNSELTVPGRKLIDICKALPDGASIELYQDKDRVVIQSGRSRFLLTTLPADDFPSVETHETHVNFQIPQNALKHLLQRTYFSMAQQDVRYYLNGMLLELSLSTLQTVATDGHRLAMNSLTTKIESQHRLQVIVPRKGILELMRLLDDTDEVASVEVGSNHIRVSTGVCTFTSKLIEGRFPDYQRVIPKNGNKFIVVDRDLLKQILSRAAILCNEKFRGVRFELRANLLRTLANNPEQEAAEEEINVLYDQDDLDIGFNVNYLLDILNIVKPGDVKLYFADSNSSLLVEEADNDNKSLFVVMPMRL